MPQPQWFAITVLNDHEKSVAKLLEHKSCEIFVPLYSSHRMWSQSDKDTWRPMFPGYVFARFDLLERSSQVVATPGVIRIVGLAGKSIPVEAGELQCVRALMNSGLEAEPWSETEPGAAVRIVQGSLEGVEGMLVKLRGGHQLVVKISLLKRAVAVNINNEWARPIAAQSPCTPACAL